MGPMLQRCQGIWVAAVHTAAQVRPFYMLCIARQFCLNPHTLSLSLQGTLLLATVVGLTACAAMFFGGGHNGRPADSTDQLNAQAAVPDWLIYLIAFLFGFSVSMLLILSVAIVADMIGRSTV